MRSRERGAFLLLAMFFSVVAATGALGLIMLLPSESASLRVARIDEESSRVAEAGVRDCMAWMSYELQIGNEPLTSPSLTRTGSLAEWTWSTDIVADPQTPPNPRGGLRMYKLISTASLGGRPRRRTTCWVQAGETLSKYAYLNNAGGGPLWDFMLLPGINTVEGPMHNNGYFKLVVPSSTFVGPIGPVLPLNGRLTSSGAYALRPDGFEYFTGGGFSAPSSSTDYDHLNKLGRSGFQAGVDPVAFPSTTSALAEAAWGGAPPTTPPPGVTVNPTGGVFIQGDVDEMTFSVVGGNSVVMLRQGATVTTITRTTDTPVGPAPLNSRLVQVGASTTVVPGLGSGVYYANGDILGLSGVVRGKNTVATNFTAGKDVEIVGNITRADTPAGTVPTSNLDKLGIVASQIRISDDPTKIPSSLSTHLYLYASMFADDQWLVESAATRSPFKGEIFGGIQSRLQAPRYCNFSGTTVVTGMCGPTGNGTPRIVGDMNMDKDPPPMYPSSEEGKMLIRYWREEPLG